MSFQRFNAGFDSNLIPLGYLPVAPGETWDGSIEWNIKSDMTIGQVFNRAFGDVYVFYCPCRLLEEQWVDFITGQGGSISPPRS